MTGIKIKDIMLINPDHTIQTANIFIVDEYDGEPLEFEEKRSMWIDLNDLYKETKVFPSIIAIKYLKDNMNLKINCESNDKIIEIIEQ